MTPSEAMRAYWSGEWCGECRYGVVEDPPCCYTQPEPGAGRSMTLPENLREELRGWGFHDAAYREHRLSDDGSTLIYENDGDQYEMAQSTYYGEDIDPHRPFLATVLDVLRWAAANAETHDSGITEEDAHEWASESGER